MTLTKTNQPLLIDGERIRTGEWHDVHSPYSDDVVGTVAWCDASLAQQAVDAAAQAMTHPLCQFERADLLSGIAKLIAERREEFAQLICAEAGKPIKFARIEADRAVDTFMAASDAARTLSGRTIPMDGHASSVGRIAYTVREPIGVVAAITPFNFPLNLVAHKVAPAIAAGCAIVLKPAEKTPLTSLLLAQVALDAGLPKGWLNVVVGPSSEVAGVFCEDEQVGLITFTGSSSIGLALRQRSQFAKVTLELGNATPVIVCEDADIESVVDTILPGAFGFAGQTCVSVQRVFVDASQYESFVDALVTKASALCVGDPSDDKTVVGPVITDDASDRLQLWISEAVDAGAKVAAGGNLIVDRLLEPTVLTDVPVTAKVSCEEVFGPIVVVDSYTDIHVAIDRANSTPYGLQAAIFTNNLEHITAAIQGLQFGSVMVNETPSFRADHMPYGGVKRSGNTKEGPAWAVREMTTEKLVVVKP